MLSEDSVPGCFITCSWQQYHSDNILDHVLGEILDITMDRKQKKRGARKRCSL